MLRGAVRVESWIASGTFSLVQLLYTASYTASVAQLLGWVGR